MLAATLKSLRQHKARLIGTSVAVVLGVAFLAGTLVFTDTVSRTFDDLFASVYENIDAEVRSDTAIDAGFGVVVRGRLPEELIDVVRSVDGVAAVEGFIEGTAQIVAPDGEPLGSPGQGPPTMAFSWTGDTELEPWVLVDGRNPVGGEEVVIDRGSARAGDIAVGDEVTILTSLEPRVFTVAGVVTFGAADSPGGTTIALFDLPTAQELFEAPGQVDAVSAAAAAGLSQAELVQRIEAALGPDSGAEVLTGAEITAETQSEIQENLAFFNTFLTVFAVIALFVSAFVIYNTFAILVAQRTRELALFRALGASRRQVITSVLAEAAIVGVIASALGVVAGLALSFLLREGLAFGGIDIPAGGLVLLPRTVVVAVIVGLAVTLASAVLPAVGASRIAPLQAMRDVAFDRSGRSLRRLIIGAVITAAGGVALLAGLLAPDIALVGVGAAAVFIGVFVLGPVLAGPLARVVGYPAARLRGVNGHLARENSTRNPTRTSRTAAALTIGVALVAGVTVLAASLRASIRDIIGEQFTGDLVVNSGTFGQGGLSPTLTASLNELPEVAAASGFRVSPAEIGGEGQFLAAVEPATAFDLFDVGLVAGAPADLTVDTIFLLDERADELGVGLGEPVDVRLIDGVVRPLRVAGIFTESVILGAEVISQELAEQTGAAQFDISTFVLLAEGVSIAEARPAVEALAAGYPNATVQDRDEYIAFQAANVDLIVNLIYGLLGLAVIIAAFGITNTLRLSVIERTREIGLLRAVGMTRRQVRSTIRWEAVITALLGAAQGIVIGVALGYAVIFSLRAEGIETFAVPSVALLVIVGLAALVGVVAAIRPARRAANLDVLDAIATE